MSTNDQPTLPDLYQTRREFILQNAPHKDVTQLAKDFFEAFSLSTKTTALDALHVSLMATNNSEIAKKLKGKDFKEWATHYFTQAKKQKKLSIQNVVEKERNKLKITGVLKGSDFIKSGMDLLTSEVLVKQGEAVTHEDTTLDIPETERPTKGKRKFQNSSEGNDMLRSPNDEGLNINDTEEIQTAQKKSKIPRLCKPSLSTKQSSIDEPWRSLLEQLHKKIKGGTAECSKEWPKALTGTHLNLYRFIEAKINSPDTMTKIGEKDLFVAMSGIVNARMAKARDIFGGDVIDHIKKMCIRPTMQEPSAVVKEVLAPLAEVYRSGGLEELLDEVDIFLGCEAKARRERVSPTLYDVGFLTLSDTSTIKPSKDMSEAELVGVWSYVINALAGHSLTFRSGELTSKATKWQRRLLQKEMELESGSSLYGRKLDLQCRTVDHLEINNSEFKTESRSEEQIEVQYRKNLRVNQAMMLYLRDQIGFQLQDLELLALDVHGLTARVFSLRYDNNVFITDLATTHLLRLPDSTASWKLFLSGETISVILVYVEHLTELIEKIDEQSLLHEQQMRIEARCTPEPETRILGDFTFFSPSKKQRDCNLFQAFPMDSDIEDIEESEHDD
ncbi:hypothetical protein BGZ49_003058 [Haplosporangium sp. Z 27]|nr:hypothetical protein BGZ49_003058 [Haplosporangium sp. Z 27]